MNYLLIEAIQNFYTYYGDTFQVESPTRTGHFTDLGAVSHDLAQRLIGLFKKNEHGQRPVHGEACMYQDDPYFQDLVLFYEHFQGHNGRGVGASHQPGWTGLVAELMR